MFSLLDESDEPRQRIDRNVHEILFSTFGQRDTESLTEYLNKCDALQVYRILQEVNKELCSVKLENVILIDFLQKNDPKMLTGLNTLIKQDHRHSGDTKRKSHDSITDSPATGREESKNPSIAESLGPQTLKTFEYRINYRTKAEMSEKYALDQLKICEALEVKGTHDIKILKGEIEELRYRCADTKECTNIFELTFIKNDTLLNATDKQKEKHLRKFINNWIRNGRALLGTMRLKITSLQEQCHQQRTILISKAELSGTLGPVDFEQLQIKRDEQTRDLDEKNVSLAGLKEVTGKAALALAKEKKMALIIEQKSKALSAKTADVSKGISKLAIEARAVEDEVILAEESLKNLKTQVEEYEAPSVTDYILMKQDLITLEKEEKLLQRKSYIQNIKLKNVAMKLRMQNSTEN